MDEKTALKVDQHKIKFAMLANLALLAIGWVLNSWIPIGVATLCQLLGATNWLIAPYFALYSYLMVPMGILKPQIITDDPIPHRFASLIGGLFLLIGTIFIYIGVPIGGWMFVVMVFTLQNLNLWVNFCMMYSMYYVLNSFGIPGFTHTPIKKQDS